ncbi:unnamed protein product [Peniophora sp. CBMAI 1063]|nr:unnamed protein product [Peniophora sp. CBMAI 1063]
MSCCALRSPLHTLSPVLRTLILENVVPWGGPAGLVHALGALAELEVFEYRWTRDHFDETITYACVLCSSPTSVRLPSLKRFVLSGFLAEDVCIFSALRLPPAAEIVVGSKSSHTWDVEESAWEEEAPGCVLGGFAGVLAAALARHLEDVVQHGMVIKDAFVTGHGLQLVLGLDRDSEGENAYKAAPSLSSSSSEAPSDSDGTGTRITFDIPPFNTPERRDIILKALISSCLSQYNIHSITYTRSLSSPSISTDLERRAPCLQALPLTLL